MSTKKIETPAALNRRSFVGGLAATPFIAGLAPRRAWAKTQADVIVVGGGISGLAAALTLEAEGMRVLLLEGAGRLGGRCYTLRTDEGHFDCGATTVGPLYGRVRYFASQAGAELSKPHGRDRFSYHLNGSFVHPDDWMSSAANKLSEHEKNLRPEALEFSLVQKFNKIEDLSDWRSEDMLQYDVPLDAYLKSNGVSDEALRLIGLTTNSMSLARTSALFQMREFSRLALPQKGNSAREVYATAGNEGYQYVKGGTSVLINKMASLLKGEPRLNHPIVAIDIDRDSATVTTQDGQRFTASHIICTAPLTSLSKIKIEPKLTGAKLTAVKNAHYARTTHVFCVPTAPYWEEDGAPAGLFTDDMIERVFANKGPDGKIAWLDVWMNGSGVDAIDQLPEAELLKTVEKRLAKLRPSTQGRVKAIASYSWGNNAFIGGNKQVYEPGTVASYFPMITEPWHSRLRFAGEHTRDFEAGLEAAAETGMREALGVLTS